MSTSIFHEETTTLRRLQVRCSTNERRKYEERSVFFAHPFYNGETEWPMKTHIVCRYDGEPFDTIPIPLPIGFNDEKNIYTCYGVFCSAACVKAFMENNPVYSNALSMMWLKKIMCEVFGDFEDIVEAPPIELLIKHGGNLDILQFRKFGKQKTRILTHRFPFFTCSLAFELIAEQTKKNEGSKITPPTVQLSSQTQSTEPSLKTVKKLQRQFNKKQQEQQQQQHQQQQQQQTSAGGSICQTEESTDVASVVDAPSGEQCDTVVSSLSTSLLPDSILQVRANSGWDIHGLQRAQSQQATSAAAQSTMKNQAPPIQPTQTKSMFQEYYEQKSQKKEPQKPVESIDTKQQPQRRRGRPKSTAKADSPKNATHGTLVSFLKH